MPDKLPELFNLPMTERQIQFISAAVTYTTVATTTTDIIRLLDSHMLATRALRMMTKEEYADLATRINEAIHRTDAIVIGGPP